MSKNEFSVLISVYNKENPKYLDESLNSVFNQTIPPNEVVLVEDGELTNELDLVINTFYRKHPEILKIIKYKENRGLGKALHDGLLECSNEIVFRMDSDDIAIPERFEKQLQIFMEMDVDVVGSNITEYDETMQNEICLRVVPENDNDIKKMVKKRNPMNHMTVAYKKKAVLNAGNYQDMKYFEDYYLWARMIKNNCQFYNIQSTLVKVRGGNDMIKRRGGKKYIKPVINFQKALYEIKLINKIELIINLIERLFISIIPSSIRTVIYKKILRK